MTPLDQARAETDLLLAEALKGRLVPAVVMRNATIAERRITDDLLRDKDAEIERLGSELNRLAENLHAANTSRLSGEAK